MNIYITIYLTTESSADSTVNWNWNMEYFALSNDVGAVNSKQMSKCHLIVTYLYIFKRYLKTKYDGPVLMICQSSQLFGQIWPFSLLSVSRWPTVGRRREMWEIISLCYIHDMVISRSVKQWLTSSLLSVSKWPACQSVCRRKEILEIHDILAYNQHLSIWFCFFNIVIHLVWTISRSVKLWLISHLSVNRLVVRKPVSWLKKRYWRLFYITFASITYFGPLICREGPIGSLLLVGQLVVKGQFIVLL